MRMSEFNAGGYSVVEYSAQEISEFRIQELREFKDAGL